MFERYPNLRKYIVSRNEKEEYFRQATVMLSMAVEQYIEDKKITSMDIDTVETLTTLEKVKKCLIGEGYIVQEELHQVLLSKGSKSITITLNDD